MAKHLARLDDELIRIATARNKRLIVEMPPRHGKSQLCSVYFPAWYLGVYPERRVIMTSATGELAETYSVQSRDLLVEYGPRDFGVQVRSDIHARKRWELTAGGGLRAAGTATAIMGQGADLFIIDDYVGHPEEAFSESQRRKVLDWYMSTASTRLTPEGAVVVIATRWHPEDLIGCLLADAERGGEQWTRLRFPALAEENDPLGRRPGETLWPERFSQEWMEQRRASYIRGGYEWLWSALYQQVPSDAIDGEFPSSYFSDPDLWFDDWPPEEEIVWRVLSLDPSKGKTDSADYSAFVRLAVTRDLKIYVEADLARRNALRIVEEGLEHIRQFNPHVFGVEINQFQEVLADLFWREAAARGILVNVKGINSTTNKAVRIRMRLTEPLARGWFRFRRGAGTELLVQQLKEFPSGRYDDGPDALEMGLQLCQHLLERGLEESGMIREERAVA